MNLLSVETISKQYGERPLFQNVSFGLNRGDRLGVIGLNGSGKTSLLRILAGTETPDSGRIAYANGIHVAYLSQNPPLDEDLNVLEAVFSGDSPTIRLLREYEQASAALAHFPNDEELLARLTDLSGAMDASGAWEAELAARTIITQLGLAEVSESPVSQLSGGQRRRVAMARALVDQPDLLILDEPTNHIDTDTVAWLEEYLARAEFALVLVTHDRYFLDRIVSRMLEIDRGQIYLYDNPLLTPCS